jgi:RimJ/RimL family protein N-acetyltransferase
VPGAASAPIELPDQLVGGLVTVRPYAEPDAPLLWEAIEESREHLAPWMPWVGAYTTPDEALAAVRRFRAKWLSREDLHVAIFDRGGQRFLGGSGLHRIDWQIRRFEIGYWVRRSEVGHGYATETVQLLTRLAFDELAANRVEIRMDVDNVPSRAVAERLGFQLEGRLRQFAAGVDGQPRDIWVFSLLPREFAALAWAPAGGGQPPT